jgi:hypothetical protein
MDVGPRKLRIRSIAKIVIPSESNKGRRHRVAFPRPFPLRELMRSTRPAGSSRSRASLRDGPGPPCLVLTLPCAIR